MNDQKLHKMVNGEKIYLGPLEEAAIRAYWEIGNLPVPQCMSIEDKMNAMIDPEKGVDFIRKHQQEYDLKKIIYDERLLDLQNKLDQSNEIFNVTMETNLGDCRTC